MIIFEGKLTLKDSRYTIGLSLVEFQEDNVIIIYSPALDLYGYGYSTEEAKESFNISLYEFLKYTTNKKTFNDVMKNLGWKIKGNRNNQKIQPPLNSELANKNPFYNEIINSKNYKSYNEQVEFSI